jgi:hypothetical protein
VALNEAEIRVFLKLRDRAQPLFPGLFVDIRKLVETELADLEAKGVVGEFDRENAMAMFPELGYAVPVDWVAFGFPNTPFYDAHVGVVLDTFEWPVQCHVGLHLSEAAWRDLRSHLDRIDWTAHVGCVPEKVVAGSVREHRYCDPPAVFEWAASADQAARLAGRAAAYYRAAFEEITGGPG